ncbi:MAG: DUF4372 domain-containing protein [Myxococcota bacterium]
MIFTSPVYETKADQGVKGFSCWGQFVAMLSCNLFTPLEVKFHSLSVLNYDSLDGV